MMMESGRGRKGPSDGRTPGPTGTWAQVKDGKGGESDEGRWSQACTRDSLSRREWEVISDKRWRLTGGGAVQVDGRSTPGRYGGWISGYR